MLYILEIEYQKKNFKTIYKLLTYKNTDYNKCKTFGNDCYVMIETNISKLDCKTQFGKFIGNRYKIRRILCISR